VLLILITWLGAMALMYGILAFTFFDLTSSLLGPLWWVVPIGLLSVLPAAILEWRRQSWGAVGLLVASCLVGAYCVEAWTSGSEHADNACIVFWCIVLPGLALGMVLLLTARR